MLSFLAILLYSVFLTTSFYNIFNLLKSTGTGTNLSTPDLATLLFKLFKPFGTFSNLSISNLSASDFKLSK